MSLSLTQLGIFSQVHETRVDATSYGRFDSLLFACLYSNP